MLRRVSNKKVNIIVLTTIVLVRRPFGRPFRRRKKNATLSEHHQGPLRRHKNGFVPIIVDYLELAGRNFIRERVGFWHQLETEKTNQHHKTFGWKQVRNNLFCHMKTTTPRHNGGVARSNPNSANVHAKHGAWLQQGWALLTQKDSTRPNVPTAPRQQPPHHMHHVRLLKDLDPLVAVCGSREPILNTMVHRKVCEFAWRGRILAPLWFIRSVCDLFFQVNFARGWRELLPRTPALKVSLGAWGANRQEDQC